MKPNLTKFPKTDCNYTAISLNGHCAQSIADVRSFRQIGDDYFKNEASHEFGGEAACFTVIVTTVAVALMSNVSALHDFVRAIGAV